MATAVRAHSPDAEAIQASTNLALSLRNAGRMDEAEQMFREILAADALQIEANLAIAWILQSRKEHTAANSHFFAAIDAVLPVIEGDPANLKARLQLATALRGSGRLAEAEEVLSQIVADHPGCAAAQFGLGWIAHSRKDPPSVSRHFSAALGMGGKDHHALMALAESLAVLERLDEAEAIYRDVVERFPDWPAVHKARAGLARRRGDLHAERDHLRACVLVEGGNLSLAMQLAKTLCDLEAWEEAEEIYRSILAQAPAHLDAWLALVAVARKRGDMDIAAQLLQEAVNAAPLDMGLRRALREIQIVRKAYDWRTEIVDALTVARSPGADPKALIEAATILVEFGLTGLAAPLLTELLARSNLIQPVRLEAGQLALAARQIERLGMSTVLPPSNHETDQLARQLDSLRGITEQPVAGSDTLLVVFGGINNRLWLTFSLLHRLLQPCGVSVAYARDVRQDCYTSGIEGLGKDFAGSVEALCGMAARMGVRRILTLGNCVGCRGAMQFGLAVQAQGVLGLSPTFRAGSDLSLDRKARLRAARSNVPYESYLRKSYAEAPAAPPVLLIHGELCENDAAEARFMSEAPGVTRVPIPGSYEHDSVKDLLVRGLLAPVLHAFVASGTVPDDLRARIAMSAATCAA